MPYIAPEDRNSLDTTLTHSRDAVTAGELNFQLTRVCQAYLGAADRPNYQTLNDIIGALEACKLEFYRRVVTSYENMKIKENGDVYQ